MTDQLNNFDPSKMFTPRAIPRITPVYGSSMYCTVYECPKCGHTVEFNSSNDTGRCTNCHTEVLKPLSS